MLRKTNHSRFCLLNIECCCPSEVETTLPELAYAAECTPAASQKIPDLFRGKPDTRTDRSAVRPEEEITLARVELRSFCNIEAVDRRSPHNRDQKSDREAEWQEKQCLHLEDVWSLISRIFGNEEVGRK